MDKILVILGGGVATIAGLALLVILGTLLGACTGWFIGLFFGETILATLSGFGASGFTMWQLGATLGFIGPFFRPVK